MARPENGNYNSITGDGLVTKAATDAYRDGWDRIFKKKEELDDLSEKLADLEEPSNIVVENAEDVS